MQPHAASCAGALVTYRPLPHTPHTRPPPSRRQYESPILAGREPGASDSETDLGETRSNELSAIVNRCPPGLLAAAGCSRCEYSASRPGLVARLQAVALPIL
jgi:hypothetical protein